MSVILQQHQLDLMKLSFLPTAIQSNFLHVQVSQHKKLINNDDQLMIAMLSGHCMLKRRSLNQHTRALNTLDSFNEYFLTLHINRVLTIQKKFNSEK